MRIAMIGTGYVGLVSGACFADFGHQVICVDKDGEKIAALHRGEIPIFEPGLDALVSANVKAGRLDFTTDLKAPVAEADAVFIAVGTPSRRGDGHADLTYVYAAAREIASALSGFTVVVTKSTVPVGTGDEIADLAEKVGADVQEVARGIGLDNRIGSKFLHAGPGFGGSCFPKDTRALVKIALDHDVQLRIVEAVLAVNDNRKRAMARKVANAAGGSLRGKTVAVLGLTFKPDTDDMREAPSIPLVTGLLDMGAKIRAHDPAGMEQARKELPDIEYCDDPYECARGADIVVIVTEWAQFRALNLARLKKEMVGSIVIDLRNVYRPEDMAAHGFVYESVGRPAEQI